MKQKIIIFIITIFIAILSSCQRTSSFCNPGTISHRDSSDPFPLLLSEQKNPQTLEIKRRNINFDQVISGQLCNNKLAGTVYVGCDIEIYAWEEKSTFLDNCNFEVKPGTIIYVASHNNTAYYKGCDSCHTSREE
jgi:hypothetical protein